jgi:DNA polymerase I-like protein with 3'-5' exonuclease and polymerase domains
LPWSGEPLECPEGYLAFDTETNVVDLAREVPTLVLATAHDGKRSVVIRPEQIGDFVARHAGVDWAIHNLAFDWHVVDAALAQAGDELAQKAWLGLLASNRLFDSMLADMLVRLAADGRSQLYPRNLAQLSKEFAAMRVDKEDKVRKEFASIVGQDWNTVDPAFFRYAVLDTVSLYQVARALKHELLVQARGVEKGWGPLTLALQTRAAVVLAEIGRNGMAVDQALVAQTRKRLEGELLESVNWLHNSYPNLFHSYRVSRAGQFAAGDLKLNAGTGVPKMDLKVLREVLSAQAIAEDADTSRLPRTAKTGEIQTGLDVWRELLPHNEFVLRWAKLAETAKLLQFLVKLTASAVHPRYSVLTRTGRTSATEPNIQQMPREPWFRELFVARPGHKLVIADYAAIELRTLAAILVDRFGRSVLAEVIKDGRDPHAYTAALMEGVSYEDFLVWKKGTAEQQARFKASRQAAKAINFGVPGGLGAAKLAVYAKLNYGVVLSPEQAEVFRRRLITEIYPEIGQYLDEDFLSVLAGNLRCDREDLAEALWNATGLKAAPHMTANLMATIVDRVYSGHPKAAGYNEAFLRRVWAVLKTLNRNPQAIRDLDECRAGPRLGTLLSGREVWTLTGRLRTGCRFTESRNTPFQALAADGAKNALWQLWLRGYKIVAFIHDEIVVEVPSPHAEVEKDRVVRVMVEAMEEVLGHGIPVEVEAHIAERWTK